MPLFRLTMAPLDWQSCRCTQGDRLPRRKPSSISHRLYSFIERMNLTPVQPRLTAADHRIDLCLDLFL